MMSQAVKSLAPTLCTVMVLGLLSVGETIGATLTGSFASLSSGSSVNLSAEGALDWVHWGFYTETSLNRKANVPPLIGDFTLTGPSNGFLAVYKDNGTVHFNWSDGEPATSVADTTALVWAYGFPELGGTGFELIVPADTTVKALKLYVGVFAARGKLVARLSDSSASAYTSTNLVDMLGSWKAGVYTIDYAAQSAGQSLIIQWTVARTFRSDGNVTLEAATLTTAGANNPPFAVITNPPNNAKFSAPADITINVSDYDADGAVTEVEFFDGANKLGDSASPPFSFVWSNAPPGYHVLTAHATDNGGASRVGPAADIFVNSTGGMLSGTVAQPPSAVNLTGEGSVDWTHWGLVSSNSFDHKRVAPRISNFTSLGVYPVVRYTNNTVGYSWNDGTPTASASGTDTGVYITGFGNGFQLTVCADTTMRQLKVYVSLYGAEGNFQAYLSDASAPAYTDESLSNFYGDSYGMYTLNYRAASAGQTLTVRYRSRTIFDAEFGNVTLQSATLSGGDLPPFAVITSPANNASYPALANITIDADASDPDGTIDKVEFYQGAVKLGEDATNSYSYTWSKVPAGTYVLTARAIDNAGETFTSATVRIVVGGSSAMPVTILNPTWSGSNFTFSFPTEMNRTYIAYYTTSLNPINWLTVTNVPGTGAIVTVTDVNPTGEQRFYRVETQ